MLLLGREDHIKTEAFGIISICMEKLQGYMHKLTDDPLLSNIDDQNFRWGMTAIASIGNFLNQLGHQK